jgi:Icc-related predicted phosphoesterase
MPDIQPVRVAAAGDLHCHESNRDAVARAFAALAGHADLVLLAGDLTTTGEPGQAAVLADACRGAGIPVIAVLGNHDWHADRRDELVEALQGGGIEVLDPGWHVTTVRGTRVGVAGAKGFIGGFAGSSHLPDFGEPALRRVYAECTAEIYGIDEGLRAISTCEVRIALLHYAPTLETIEGEPRGIWAFLGTDRLAAPILEHEPDLALHGHAHIGAYEGRIGSVPVYNVSVPVIGRDFQVFELSPTRAATPIH